jgi:hypothetical protein
MIGTLQQLRMPDSTSELDFSADGRVRSQNLIRLRTPGDLIKDLSFPKIPSARIRALRQNQSIILGDACMPSAA